MKRGTDNLLKFKKLKAALGLPTWQVKGILQSIWDFTAENAMWGDIGKYSDDDIAFGIEYEGDAPALITALVETGWIDPHATHRLVVHDWHEHAEDWVKKRVQRSGRPFASEEPAPADNGHRHVGNGANQEPAADNGGQCRTPSDNVGLPRPRPSHSHGHNLADTEADARGHPPPMAPVRVGSVGSVSAILNPTTPEAYAGEWATRVMAVSREPPKYRAWWLHTIGLMVETDGLGVFEEAVTYAENCGDPAIRKAKDLGPLKLPGAYIADKCKRWLHQHGKRLPRPP